MIEEVPMEFRDKLLIQIPTGIFGSSDNICGAVNFLINNDYINGVSIDINGCHF